MDIMTIIQMDLTNVYNGKNGYYDHYTDGFDECVDRVENFPAADVEEVKHGKWIEYPRAHYFKCSECKETVPYKKAVLIRGKRKYKYCPHCGAKMGAEG